MPILSRAAFGTAYGGTPYVAPPTTITSINNTQDTYLVRYDLNGGALWAARIGGLNTEVGFDVNTDTSGNVYVTGTTTASIQAYNADGTTAGVIVNTSAGSADVFLIKYTPGGKVLWLAKVGSPSADTVPALSVDTSGNIALVGQFGSGTTVTAYNSDGTVFGTTVSALGSDAVVVKYNSNGFVQWIAKTGSSGTDIGYGVGTDSTGSVYICGQGSSGATITAYNASGTPFGTTIPNAGANDAFIVKYNSAGSVQWVTRIASTGADSANSIVVDNATSSFYVAGQGGSAVATTAYNSDGTAFATTIPSAGSNDAFLVKYDLNGFVQWVTRVGSTGSESGSVVRVDSSSNVYMIGSHNGTATAYNSNGTTFSPTVASTGGGVFVVKYNSSGFVQWITRIETSGADTPGGISIDSGGNVYASMTGANVTGAITVYNAGGTTFGTLPNVGNTDTCIVKYNSAGAVQWMRRLASLNADAIRGLTIGPSNDLYAVGSFAGSQLSLFGPQTLVSTIPNAGLIDGFVVKYNQNGSPQWTARVASTADDSALGTATDSSGNLYVTGATGSGATTTFYNANGSAFGTTLTSVGTDAYIAKYNENGSVVWVASISSTGADVGYAVATDSSGNIYVTGAGGTATVTAKNSDGSSFSPTLTSDAGDAFVVKYNSSGFVQWNTRIASTADDVAFAITTDSTNNIYVTGQGGSAAAITVYNSDGSTFETLPNLGGRDTFVVKYNANGTGQWCARIGGTGDDIGYGITTDSNNNVYIVGGGGSADVSAYNSGGGSSFGTVANAGSGDAFIVKYNSAGTGQWITRIASTGQDTAYSISTDALDNFYLVVKAGTITLFNANGTSYPHTFSSAGGGQDAFVVKYSSAGLVQWVSTIGGSTSNDTSFSIKADTEGNTYVAGIYPEGADMVTVRGSAGNVAQFFRLSALLVKFDTNGRAIWAQFLRGSTTSATGRSLSIDVFNNVYLSGNTVSAQPLNVYYNDFTPYITLTTTGTQDAFVAKYSSSMKPQWATRITSTGTTDSGFSIVSDSSGNVYAIGNYTATGATIPTIWNANGSSFGTLANAGSGGIFIIKYDSNGYVVWATRIDGAGADTSLRAVIDSSNNLYVCGYSSGASGNVTPYNSDGSAFTAITMGGGANNDAYIVKYNTAGQVQWTARMFASASSDDLINGIATDTSGNVYVTGSYTTATFTAYSSNGVAFGTTLANAGGLDIFVVKYNSSGTVQWVTRVASTSTSEQGNGIAADSSGNVYIAAQFIGTMTAYNSDGSASALPTVASGGSSDGLVIKYDTSGTAQWMARIGSTLADTCTSVSVDSAGDVYATGTFINQATVSNAGNGSSVFATLTDAQAPDTTSVNAYIVKYNSSGTAQWAAKVLDSLGQTLTTASFLKIDSAGNVYFAGSVNPNAVCYNADGSLFANTWNLPSTSSEGIVLKYNSSGIGQMAVIIGGGSTTTVARGVEIDSTGNVYVTGMFNAFPFTIGSS